MPPRIAPVVFSAACLMGALAGAGPALAQAAGPADAALRPATLNLHATGEARRAPDQAVLTLGVTTTAATARGASRDNAVRADRLVAALKAAGLTGRDLQTSRLSLAPRYAEGSEGSARVVGYEAQNQVVAVVRDLSALSGVVDAAAEAGATDLGAVAFGLADPQAAQDEARRDAVRRLDAQARLYAAAEALRLGRLVNLTETGADAGEPPRPMMAFARKAGASTPVEPGEIVVRVEVSAVYELAR